MSLTKKATPSVFLLSLDLFSCSMQKPCGLLRAEFSLRLVFEDGRYLDGVVDVV